MELNNEFEYVAFISYDHSDTKIASKIQSKLEHYVVPGSVRKNLPRLPKHVRPIFRDDTDMGGGPLRETLKKELSKSKYLIVICSPESAKSSWVNDEVKIFRELGREKFIIPVIVAGEAHSEYEDNECFCHQLLECLNSENDELIGLNVCKQGLEKVIIQILSLILDVDFKVLWNREELRKKQKRIRIFGILSILALIVMALIWYLMPTYRYYSDYVEQWGVPVGINELDKDIRSHKKKSYRFKYKRIPIGQKYSLSKRVVEVSMINSNGIIIENSQREFSARYSIYKYSYSPYTGNLREITSCDAMGNELFRQKISSDNNHNAAICDLVGTRDEDDSGYLDSYTAFSPIRTNIFESPKSNIKRILYTRNNLGFLKKASFHSSNSDDLESSKTADANGAYGQAFKTDSMGRVIEMSLLDEKDNVINGINGVGKIRITYSGNSVSSLENLDCYDNPVLNENLIFKITYEYDNYGNIISEKYWGINNQRTYNINNVSGMQATYDLHGHCERINMLNAVDGKSVDKYGVHKICFIHDSKGRDTRIEYIDNSGFYVKGKEGYAAIEMKYHKNTSIPIYIQYFGVDNKLMKNPQGIACIKREINTNNKVCAEEYFDNELNRTLTTSNISKIEYNYNSKGNLLKVRFFDINDKPCKDIFGTYGGKYEYDRRGNLVYYTNIDNKNGPMNNKNNVAILLMNYDNSGRIIERSCYDSTNTPIIDKETKVHKYVYEYGLWGIFNRVSSYGINDSLCLDSNGVAVTLYESKLPGCISKTSYLDTKLNPVENNEGISYIEADYTDDRNQTSLRFYDKNHHLVNNSSGIAIYKSSYNKQGRQTSYAMLDANNKLVIGKDGYAILKNTYNDQGLLLLTEYYDCHNKLSDNAYGYARRIRKYDTNSNFIEETTTDTLGKLALDSLYKRAKLVLSYDRKGNLIKKQAYGPDSRPIVCSYGYSTWIAKYSDDGRMIGFKTYDENNKSINNINNILSKSDKNIYNKDYFQYNLFDCIIGICCIIFFAIIVLIGIKENSIIIIACAIIFAGLGFMMTRDYLMYHFLIPVHIYNLSWIFLIICIISCLYVFIVFTFYPLKEHFISLCREWQNKRWISPRRWYKRLYKNSDLEIGTTISLVMVEIWLCSITYILFEFMLDIILNQL